jgi:hypothetical protein
VRAQPQVVRRVLPVARVEHRLTVVRDAAEQHPLPPALDPRN